MSTYSFSAEVEARKPEEAVLSARSIWGMDNNRLLLLLGITFVSVYYTPAFANRFIFFVFLIFAYRSKNDCLWLVWFFILNDAPGRLFSAEGLLDKRIPLYSITEGISITFQELFLFTYLIKVFFKRKEFDFVFKWMFKYFYIVIGVFLLYSVLIGMNAENIVKAAKFLLPWAWIMIIPYYLPGPKEIGRACQMIFPFVFIGIGFQIHTFITGNYLDYMLRGEELLFSLAVEDSEKASRAWVSVFIMLYALTQALVYMVSKKRIFNSDNYLAAVVFTAVASIFLSATRGWILSFSFLIICSVFLMSKGGKFKRLISLAFASIVIIYILQMSFPFIRSQFEAALERFSTLQLLLSGDLTAGGTLKRIDVRGKLVLQQFYYSPLIGWGFSDIYFRYADGHVGQQNILLNVGIIGFIYLNLFYAYLCVKIWLYSKDKQIRSIWGSAPLIYVFALIAVFIIHGSSTQFWGFIMHFEQTKKIIVISFILASFNAMVVYALSDPPEEEDMEGIMPGGYNA